MQAYTEAQTDKICYFYFVLGGSVFLSLLLFYIYTVLSDLPPAITMFSHHYFVLCAIGGVFSGLPHTILTPIDVVKCRIQGGMYKSFSDGFRTIVRDSEGKGWRELIRQLFVGYQPCFIGYSIQGAGKFGFYEYFKYAYATYVFGADANRQLVFLIASATAETIADVGLAPWEAIKVRIQIGWDTRLQMSQVLPEIWMTEGYNGFYKGLTSLWCRQVPYTIVKFWAFENIIALLYTTLGIAKETASKEVQLILSMVAGFLAGVLCALVSHPADTLVSKINSSKEPVRGGIVAFIHSIGGWGQLWTGLSLRLAMIGTLTAMQWVFYDTFKVAVGLPTTGGAMVTAAATPQVSAMSAIPTS